MKKTLAVIIAVLLIGLLFAALYPSLMRGGESGTTTSLPTKSKKFPPPKKTVTSTVHVTTSVTFTEKTKTVTTSPGTTIQNKVSPKTSEKIRLSFPYIYEKPANWNGKCIIFVHGMGRDKSVWRRDMDEFKKYGYCVFAFDLPHHGERGRYEPKYFYDVVKTGSEEILLIEKFLREDGATEVYLISRSLGSIVAGVALGESGIEKATLLLASANLTYVFSNVEPKTEQEREMIQELLSDFNKLKEIDPLYRLPEYDGMIHFHCGKKDPLLPPKSCIMAYEAASSATERKIIWHDLGHAMPFEEYFNDVLAFFEGTPRESGLLASINISDDCGDGICGVDEDWRSCPYDCIGKRLLVAFQLHIEESPGKAPYYNESREIFMKYADTLDRLAEVFEKHGAKLSIQTEKQFADADVKFGRLILRELLERGHGIGVQSHMGHHISELGLVTDEQKLEYTRAVKEVVAKAIGREPTNIGGGFEMENIGLLGVCDGCLGFISMTAVEKPYFLKTGKTPTRLHPWILPNVQMIDLKTEEWLIHDEYGSLVYIPGWYKSKSFEIDCRHDSRCFDAATASLQEALKDLEEGMINTWYASSHLYQCGVDEEAEKVLNAYDEWLGKLKPLVKKEVIVFLTFDEIAEIYLKWEKARQRLTGQVPPYSGSPSPTSDFTAYSDKPQRTAETTTKPGTTYITTIGEKGQDDDITWKDRNKDYNLYDNLTRDQHFYSNRDNQRRGS